MFEFASTALAVFVGMVAADTLVAYIMQRIAKRRYEEQAAYSFKLAQEYMEKEASEGPDPRGYA